MLIGPSIALKEDEVKQSEEILPQIGGSFDQQPQTIDLNFMTYYLQDQIIGNQNTVVRTRSLFKDHASYVFVLEIEPKTIDEALIDDDQMPWRSNFTSSSEMMFGHLFLRPKTKASLEQDGCSETNQMNRVKW